MALFQPSNITPSTLAGVGQGVVDVNDNLNITWQVNGNSPMSAFEIALYENETQSTLINFIPKTSLSTPFWGKDARGNFILYSYTPNQTWSALFGSSVVNGSSYKFKITLYWMENNVEQSVTQQAATVFNTRATPTLSIDSLSVTSISNTFSANYQQSDGDTINWCRWVLALKNGLTDERNVLYDTGPVNTGVLEYVADGLVSGQTYSIQCTVETQGGYIVTTGWNDFTPVYETTSSAYVTVPEISEDSSVLLSLDVPYELEGVASPNYGEFLNNALILNRNATVRWDNSSISGLPVLDFMYPFSIGYCVRLSATSTYPDPALVLQYATFTLKITHSSTTLNFFINEETEPRINYSIPQDTEKIVVSITPNNFNITFLDYDEGVIQSITTQNNLPYEIILNVIELTGSQICEWICVKKGIFNFTQTNTKPIMASDVYFLTQFESSSLNALSSSITADGFYLYRQEGNIIRKIAQIPPNTKYLRDYGVKSLVPVTYEAIFKKGFSYSPLIQFDTICQRLLSYYLIEASADEDDPTVFNVINVWRFGNNVSAGSVSNNNSPTWLTNFTPYRLRQPVSRKGKSGVLQALISNAKNGKYEDDVDQMEALFALSSSINTLFLKDTKGNLYMVATSGAIVQTINTRSREQEVTVSIPWEEIGDASGISLIQMSSDPLWVEDQVSLVTLNVDTDTGMLIATYPDNYQGTTFNLYGNKLFAETEEGIIPATVSLNNNAVVVTTEG